MDASPKSLSSQLPLEPEKQSASPRKPCLLPAFEPFSSSPVLPCPGSSKRKHGEQSPSYPKTQLKYYPTPVPTSSTGMMLSSPQHAGLGLTRTVSMLSERQPLGAVPTIDLPADGEIVKMGRSTNSSDYQLSTNRLISRVHVQGAYHAPSASYPNGYIELECLGWNGAKIHCKGRIFELQKGDTYMTENKEAEIMLDVQDTRVMIAWPIIPAKIAWDSDDDTTPTRHPSLEDPFVSSPPVVLRSPVSQSPIRQPVFTANEQVAPTQPGAVQIFEDADAGVVNANSPTPDDTTFICPAQSRSVSAPDAASFDPKASVLTSFNSDDFSDADEENDPVVHSFGPYGENLLPRLASFTTTTPTQPGSAHCRRTILPPKLASMESILFKNSPIKNHVINQLAYSRLHSQPLSAIHTNLPAELKTAKSFDSQGSDGSEQSAPVPQLSKQDLKKLLDETACVGEIPRSGKDAAGQPLENEFYYVPEMDTDTTRRETVTMGMRGAGGLRAVRKQHKQYYWKKPRV
ncbi:hypothetical protein P280DRAFT_402569 [Massarina eburnea CBS 473.64]|uniref:FHA domain-containing protein n=1 Tax=Massarina eburnea CBS 473.64 TaxID=1395130 RepID=A0A6A6RVB3_9PLEO|nr:hypothetical protein P280DRAFT_402569 [Massarina eburnea CBS 473.64]